MAEVMHNKPNAPKPTPEGEATFRRWLAHLDEEFTRHTGCDRRSEIVRDELHMLLLGKPHGGRSTTTLETDLPLDVRKENFDPRNVSLAGEMPSRGCDSLDPDRFAAVKPLIWFWLQFDRSPLGLNLWLGFRFRAMLGSHIFASIGKDVYIYPGVTFLRGYNITLADNTRLEPNTYIDDRYPVRLTGNVSQ